MEDKFWTDHTKVKLYLKAVSSCLKIERTNHRGTNSWNSVEQRICKIDKKLQYCHFYWAQSHSLRHFLIALTLFRSKALLLLKQTVVCSCLLKLEVVSRGFQICKTHLCRDVDKSNGEIKNMSKQSVSRICFTFNSDS